MEPIPESVIAAEELGPFSESDELLEELMVKGAAVREMVPECIGLSLASRLHGVTFTLVASGPHVALLDAGQYLQDGPCVQAITTHEVVARAGEDLLDEQAWQIFAQLSAAHDVRSSLTLPITGDGPTAGTVNLYATSDQAFDGHHERIAELLGAWAEAAVTNADLSFSTRHLAEQAPEVLASRSTIHRAEHLLAEDLALESDTAARRLADAARRAGISIAQLAEALVRLRE